MVVFSRNLNKKKTLKTENKIKKKKVKLTETRQTKSFLIMNKAQGIEFSDLKDAIHELTLLQQVYKSKETKEIFPLLPQYADDDEREKTFETFPKCLKIKHEDLAKSGFVYSLRNIKSVCFYSGCIMDKVKYGDNPFVRHAIINNKCKYINQLMGKLFVEQCQKLKDTWDDETEPESSGSDDDDDRQEPPKCRICIKNLVNFVALGCFHTYCESCLIEIKSRTNKCAYCCQTITGMQKIYFL